MAHGARGLRASRASAVSERHRLGDVSGQRVRAGGGRSSPGAVSVAMSAASIGMVPEPHIGSHSTCAEGAYSACSSIAAARVSRSAAACTACPAR
eukprot:jgi/Chrpa1/12937/Chrysochromulina_OHIO_Genome00020330-RA